MNPATPTARSAAFAFSATLTLAMLAAVGTLFGTDPQAAATMARAATDATAQVVVIEGKRVARS